MSIKIIFKEIESKQMLSMRKQFVWKDAGDAIGGSFGELMKYAGMNRLKMASPPICLAHSFDRDGGDMECGILLQEPNSGTDTLDSSMSYGGKVAVIEDKSDYDSTGQAWTALFDHLEENKIEKNGTPWEEYTTDPTTEPDMNKWESKLYQPIK